MGFWKSKRGIGGDTWADILDNAQERLIEAKYAPFREPDVEPREITMAEFADCIEFCTRGYLKVELNSDCGEKPLSFLLDASTDTISNRGQIHCRETKGCLLNV